MRRIVACPACHQQFDASGWATNSRFRCHCGNVVVVQEMRAHDSSVVRCSSCGGPRQGQDSACRHCGSQFTLHERDLDTVCPHCMTRISSRSKFCHSCGTHIRPEANAGEQVDHGCPVCGENAKLWRRPLGGRGLVGLECRACAGLWLDHDMFKTIVGAVERQAEAGGQVQKPMQRSGVQKQAQRGPAYRKCVRCSTVMNRTNYAKRSDVIVDVCRSHGIWFDAEELSQIIAWIAEGGLEQSKRHDKLHERQARREHVQRMSAASAGNRSSDWTDSVGWKGWAGIALLDIFLD